MTSRHNCTMAPRRRPYTVILNAHDSNTSNTRETIATPTNGTRLRVIRVRAIQEQADGRRLYKLYFGTGADITTNPEKALDIPNLGKASTRTYLRGEGPRGDRNEVLSGR